LSNGADNNTITITKNVGQAQELSWKLTKSTTGTNQTTWILQRAGNRTLKTVSTVSGSTTTDVVTLTDGAGAVAQKFQKVYEKMSWNSRELVSETDDPDGSNLVTTYTYGSTGGAYGKLTAVTKPDGTYTAYDYYSDDANFGNLAHTYTRWLDVASTAATASATNAHVVTLTYKPVHGFMADALDTTTTTVPGPGGATLIGKTVRNPDFTSTTFNTHKVRKETIRAYYNATSYLTTTRLSYHPDEVASDLSNQLISETAPDGTKQSLIHYNGYFQDAGDSNSTIFKASSSGMTNPISGYGEYKFNGFSSAVTNAALVNTFDGQAIDPVYLVANRSTIELTVVVNGQPTYKVTYVFTGASGGVPSFEFVGRESTVTAISTDATTGITTTTKTHYAHTGELSQQTYINGRLISETGNDGSTVTYNYDGTGLLSSKMLGGMGAAGNYAAQRAVYTHFTYDGASRKLSEKTSDSSDPAGPGPTIFYHYDSAGRLDQQTDPSGLLTSISYDLPNHTTTSSARGATKVITTYADGATKSVTGTGVVGQYTGIAVNNDGTITTTVYTLRSADATNPTAAPRWSKSTVDWLGRTTRAETPAVGGTVARTYTYNSKGEPTVVSTVDGSSGTKLVADVYTDYNAYEMPYRTGSDLDTVAGLQTTSVSDRITESDSYFQKDASNVWWLVKTTQVYNQPSVGTAVTTGTSRTRLNQFAALGAAVQADSVSKDVFGNETETKVAVDRANRLVTSTTIIPTSSVNAVSVTRNGLLVSQQSAATQVVTFAYDSLRRLVCTSDPRIDGSSLAKDLSPRIGYYDNTAPVGARYQKAWTKDTAGNQTTYSYSSATGLLSAVQSPSVGGQPGKFTYFGYSRRGETIRTWGAVAYPFEYAFNDYGEKIAMRTFRGTSDFTSSAWPRSDEGTDPQNPDPGAWSAGDKTTWLYDTATGVLLNKTDAAGKAVGYTYTKVGQVRTKTWARNVAINYKYNGDDAGDPLTGELKSVDYSDTTNTNPDIAYTYNRLGQPSTVVDATGTRSFAYDAALTTLQSETLPGLFNNGSTPRVLTQKYDTTNVGKKGRNTGFSLGTSAAPTADYDVTYGYDTYGRAGSVASGGTTFTYGYATNSNLVASISDGGSYSVIRAWMTDRDALGSIETKYGGTTKSKFAYAVDEWGRRTSAVRSGEVYSRYINQGLVTTWGYDDRSQVTSAQTYYGQSATDLSYPVEGRSFGFSFDNIGNRLTSSVDGRATSYNSNALNQITDRVTPGSADVSGFAPTGSAVQVNGQAVDRQGDYYHAVASVSNSSSAVNATISVTSTAPSSSISRKIFVAKSTLGASEQWQYDEDGNLKRDDQWSYGWDAENRLVSIESRSDLVSAGVISAADARHLDFKYDYLGRRAEKIVRSGWNGTTYATVQSDTRFIYHGWNLVAELSFNFQLSTFNLGRTYTWGLDLSGTLAGDGGTGGLLMTLDGATQYVYAYDGNGNVSCVMNRSTGATVAEYEYGAFGDLLRASNTYAQTNPFRFSTQYSDNETALIWYGYRYYSPAVGRFLGRDPSGEDGGMNLYAMCSNNLVDRWDLLGREPHIDRPAPPKRHIDASSGEDMSGPSQWSYGGGVIGPATGWIRGVESNGYIKSDSGNTGTYNGALTVNGVVANSNGQVTGANVTLDDGTTLMVPISATSGITTSELGILPSTESLRAGFGASDIASFNNNTFGIGTGLINGVTASDASVTFSSGSSVATITSGSTNTDSLIVATGNSVPAPSVVSGNGSSASTTTAAPNSGDSTALQAIIDSGAGQYAQATPNGRTAVRAPTPAEVEIGLMRAVGRERDPVRRARLESELEVYRQREGLRPPGSPRDVTISATTPVGRSGSPIYVVPPNNTPTIINGLRYSGHALDQMQGRGFVPSVVEDTLMTGIPSPGNLPGTTVYFNMTNNVRVVMNNNTGNIITVIPGGP
jgi:RHS repeat-associated protein